MPSLFEDDDKNGGGESGIRVNTKFAKHYESYREKEEYEKLKAKFADHEFDDSSSSEEEIGPDAITDEHFLKVLSAIRRKDPSLYDETKTFLSSDSNTPEQENETKRKRPLLLDEYERNVMLSQAENDEDEESHTFNDDKSLDFLESKSFMLYNDEQKKLKRELSKVTKDDSLSQEDNLLVPKQATTLDSGKPFQESEEFQTWFHENETVFTEKERNLLQFIVDQSQMQKFKSSADWGKNVSEDDEECESDTDFVEKQEEQEALYNFRFETPGGCTLKSFPRQVTETLRQPSAASRSEKRKESKVKQKVEEDKLHQEMKRLKHLKKKELMSKLDKIKASSGNENFSMNEEDLETDFDPDKHDAFMEQNFDEQYYEVGDDESEDIEKPEFSDIEDDAPSVESSTNDIDNILEKATGTVPVFDPSIETFESYLEKNYNLDLDAIVEEEVSKKADNFKPKYRFKYRETTSDSFGLTVEEILGAPDRELNAWVSLKKASQYRDEKDEFYDKQKFEKRGNDKKKKAQILSSLYKSPEEVPSFDPEAQQFSQLSDIKFCAEKKRKKKKPKTSDVNVSSATAGKVMKKTTGPKLPGVEMTDQRLKAYGIKNPSKFRNAAHHKSKQQTGNKS